MCAASFECYGKDVEKEKKKRSKFENAKEDKRNEKYLSEKKKND